MLAKPLREKGDRIVEQDGLGLGKPANMAAAVVDLEPAVLVGENLVGDAAQHPGMKLLAAIVGFSDIDAGILRKDRLAGPTLLGDANGHGAKLTATRSVGALQSSSLFSMGGGGRMEKKDYGPSAAEMQDNLRATENACAYTTACESVASWQTTTAKAALDRLKEKAK